MDRAWENDGYKDWAVKWMHHCGLSPERIEQRRRQFYGNSETQSGEKEAQDQNDDKGDDKGDDRDREAPKNKN